MKVLVILISASNSWLPCIPFVATTTPAFFSLFSRIGRIKGIFSLTPLPATAYSLTATAAPQHTAIACWSGSQRGVAMRGLDMRIRMR